MSKFVHNKSIANVSLIEGKVLIPVGGKISISDQEATHSDVMHALRKGWISIEGSKSITPTPAASEGITFQEDEMKGSTTIPVVEKKVEATSTSLGTEVKSKPSKKSKKASVVETE